MEKDYWLKKWQSQDIAFHQQNINPDLITYIHKLNLQLGDCILVPLCGKTRVMLWLADKGYHIIGVELSSIACIDFFSEMNIKPEITENHKFMKYRHDNIELLCGDIFDLAPDDLPTTHAVYDCKALIALPQVMRKKYVDHLVTCLGNKIDILLITIESNCKDIGPPFSVTNDEVNSLYDPYFNVQQLQFTPISQIPEHLIKKGYDEMKESVYLISKIPE